MRIRAVRAIRAIRAVWASRAYGLASILAVAAVVAVACSNYAEGERCANDDDCESGLICKGGSTTDVNERRCCPPPSATPSTNTCRVIAGVGVTNDSGTATDSAVDTGSQEDSGTPTDANNDGDAPAIPVSDGASDAADANSDVVTDSPTDG